jgi:hypothetical protein
MREMKGVDSWCRLLRNGPMPFGPFSWHGQCELRRALLLSLGPGDGTTTLWETSPSPCKVPGTSGLSADEPGFAAFTP